MVSCLCLRAARRLRAGGAAQPLLVARSRRAKAQGMAYRQANAARRGAQEQMQL
eukprot:CAMPEP_0170296760 /NCGR_PEP_ID=MMETSP0116_2-20130129/48531_1 /TAXON_ID=400756 /ORGANISM="Durinskia baltica, Strain CSIRO CS-38" /LENGTH=53 /DNA_ID=CAMNT_0010548365 /DNA_START=12 /DNA_END=173 /DNA_ORIENTATION=-